MKNFKLGSLLLVVVLLVSGCNLSAGERIMKADKKMDELDNYRMKLSMAVEMSTEGEIYNFKIDDDTEVDNTNNITHLNFQMNMFDFNVGAEIYTVMNDKSVVVYTKTDDNEGWSKESGIIEESSEQNDSVDNIIDIVVNGAKIEEKETTDGVTHYIVTLNKESVEKLLEESSELSGNDVIDDSYEITSDLAVDIYINNANYITSLVVDFSDVIKYTEEDIKIAINKFQMKFDFSDFNTIGTITVPQDIIDNAVEMEEE